MVCGGVIETDKDEEHFWIRKEDVSILSGPKASFLLEETNLIRVFSGFSNKIEDIFRKSGPLGRAP